jgi:PST family polysaccharide transporter
MRSETRPAWRDRAMRRPTRAVILANAGWLLGDRVFRTGGAVLISIMVARYLGPDQFGALAYALSVVAVFASAASLGLPDIVIRELVRRPDDRRAIMASAFAMRCVAAVAVLALALLTAAIAGPADGHTLTLVLLISVGPVAQAMDVVESGYQATNQVRGVVLRRNLAFVVQAALRILAVVLHAPLIVFAALTSLEAVGAAFLLWQMAQAGGRDFGLGDLHLAEARRLFGASWPLLVRSLAIGVYMRFDQVLLGHLAGLAAVGLYAAAARVSEAWYLLPSALVRAATPALVARHRQDVAAYEALLARVMGGMVWAAIAFALAMSLLATPLIRLTFGAAYLPAAPVLAVHAWGAVLMTMGAASTQWLINQGLTRLSLVQSLLGCAADIGANLVLIPAYGVMGAAVAMLIGQLVSVSLGNLCFAATRPVLRLQMRALLLPVRPRG